MSTRATEKYFLGALLVLVITLFFFRLGSYPLIGPDEPRYAQVAREMWQRKDLITPTIGGHLWAEKPVLTYWLMMATMSLLGVTEWAARLPSALLAAGTVLGIYITGRRAISPAFGFFSAVILAASALFASFAHGASTDMPLAAMMTLGLCSFFLFDAGMTRSKNGLILMAYGWFGLAMLAKGLVGVILPAAIIFTYLALTGRLAKLRDLRLIPGGALFLAVASTWYAPVIAQHGWTFVNEFFISHHFQRFMTPKFHHPGPFYYFVPVILLGLFPWTAFLISALTRLRWRRRLSVDPRERLRWYCVVWLAVPLLFFSFSASKLPGYILPALPAAAVLAAGEWDRLFKSGADRALRVSLYVTAGLIAAVAIAGTLYAGREIHPSPQGSALILGVAVVTGGAVVSFSLRRKFRAALGSIIMGSMAAALLVSYFYLPAIAERESLRRLAYVALREMAPDERVVGYHYFHHTLTFYTNARSFYDAKGNVLVATSPNELVDRVRREGTVLCVTRNSFLPSISRDRRFRLQMIDRCHDIVLVRLAATKDAP